MCEQSIQEVFSLIACLFLKITESKQDNVLLTDKHLNHKNFFKLKEKFPDYFKRLRFDTNGGKFFSEDLDGIFIDYLTCGLMLFQRGSECWFNTGSNNFVFKNQLKKADVEQQEFEKIFDYFCGLIEN